ncbi:MAG TPA: hypothetical protein VFW89_04935 [Gemmatimonadaceae bacterium]|nr:hypothetical protein [Gemmatimonadaceae bacterium]
MSAAIVIFWAMIGVVVGALIAAFVARVQLTGLRRVLLSRIRGRDRVIERMKGMITEMSSRAQQHDEVLAELAVLRRDRPALAADLDKAQRTITALQQALDAARAATRDVDLRLTAALETERHENIARRAAASSELAAAQESALNLRAELASMRDASSRTTVRLEADLAAARNLFERTTAELHVERTAASELRAELMGRIKALEEDRTRLEGALTAAQRNFAEKSASLRSYVATLKEQYALATTERDAAAREADLQRARARDIQEQLDAARGEYASRLDEEHLESVNLLSRVWDYVHNYPRLRERPVTPRPEPEVSPPPAAAAAAGTPAADATASPEATGAAGEAASSPADAPDAEAPVAVPPPRAHHTPVEREVPSAPAVLADAPRKEDAYDIEQAMSEPDTTPEEQPASPEPPRSISSPEGTIQVRRPVSAMRRDNEVLVICDDGTMWARRASGWVQEPPIPGAGQ